MNRKQPAPTTALSQFSFHELTLNVVLDESKNPWFNANEVCEALGYANPRQALASHVDDEDVQKLDTTRMVGNQHAEFEQVQAENYVNEPGLYGLVFGSELPTAKPFKRWVFSEVLPALRRTGTYTVPEHRKLEATTPQLTASFTAVMKGFKTLDTHAQFALTRSLVRDLGHTLHEKMAYTLEMLECMEEIKLTVAERNLSVGERFYRLTQTVLKLEAKEDFEQVQKVLDRMQVMKGLKSPFSD